MQFQSLIPFVEHLGLELLRVDPGEAEIALRLRDELMNGWGVAHGGVTMTLLDVAMAQAARSPLEAGGEAQPSVVTIEMKTSFMRPGQGPLLGKGRLMRRTRSMAFTEATIYNEAGEACAHSTGTFKYVRRTETAGQAPGALPTD